ncbi:MAG: amidase [Myxococcota bacterium]
MSRLALGLLMVLAYAPSTTALAGPGEGAGVVEVGLRALADELASGKRTSASLVAEYQARIASMDRAGPALRAVIELNPEVAALAASLDEERKAGHLRGPLHGIPILVKDNIDTADRMSTTAGSLALDGVRAAQDAFVIARLRAAGLIILGKTNLSEWANARSTRAASGWSGRGGLVKNPYALDRSACGSSSGTGAAIAASFAAAGVGTETDGSIICPSSMAALVGLKPTLGRISRTGIIPLAHSQDTAGPMARSVEDALLLFEAMIGADPEDATTGGAPPFKAPDLGAATLKGKRIGILRSPSFGFGEDTAAVLDQAVKALRDEGAVVVERLDSPSFAKLDACETPILQYELKHDLDQKLGALGPEAKVHSLADLIAFNRVHAKEELVWFGQEFFERAQAMGPLTTPAYGALLKSCKKLARAQGLDPLLAKHHLDALVSASAGPAWVSDLVIGDHYTGGSTSPAAVAGYPSLTVPAGQIHGLPVGISFTGPAWSEARLFELAAAFERATHARRPPRYLPAAEPH